MNQAQETFHCNACGHRFAGMRAVVERQPTCPKCRTFGQIVGTDGRPVTSPRSVPRPRPAAAKSRPGRGGPVGPRRGADGGYVEVRADIAYGRRNNPRAVATLVILLVLGAGIVATLYFIVTTVQKDHTEQARKEKEEVLDEDAFDEAVEKAVGDVRAALNRVDGAEIIEEGDIGEVVRAIREAGGHDPGWTAPPRPGRPFRAHGFVARHEYKGIEVKGFVVLLYYRTAEEVAAAESELRSHFGRMPHYGVRSNRPMWYVAYMGVSHGGPLRDALSQAMGAGEPSSFKQFTDRMGATARD